MSKNLPFWNEKETDVLIEYRFQFGHILMPKHEFGLVQKNIQRVFNLKKPVGLFETLDIHILPYNSCKKIYLLNNKQRWHFILAELANNVIAIYAPHFLFFNNSKWIKLSKLMKSFLIVSEQYDNDLFHYTIFDRGELFCNVYSDSEGIHKSTHAPVNIYLDGKILYHKKDDSEELTSELKGMILNDVVINGSLEKSIKFKVPIINTEVQPISVHHIVYEDNGAKN